MQAPPSRATKPQGGVAAEPNGAVRMNLLHIASRSHKIHKLLYLSNHARKVARNLDNEPKMPPQNDAHILTGACIALTLLLTTANTAVSRPAGHSPPPASHGSGQTITLYTTGAAPPNAGGNSSSKQPIFASHGPIGHSGSFLRALTRSGALRPGTVTVVDEQFHGKRESGLPLAGKLQGVLVAGLDGNSSTSRMVAVKALFAGDGAEDSLRFFGILHDGLEESHVAVVGGTGRYDGAAGFAVVRAADVPEIGGNVSLSRALSFNVHLK